MVFVAILTVIAKAAGGLVGFLFGGRASRGLALRAPIKVMACIGNQTIKISAAPLDRIINIKWSVRESTGKSVESQKIYFNGEECKNERTLLSYGIDHGSTVQVSFEQNELPFDFSSYLIDVKILHPEGGMEVTVFSWNSIHIIKLFVTLVTDKPVEDQNVYFNRRECNDDDTLQSCGIKDGSTVYVTFIQRAVTADAAPSIQRAVTVDAAPSVITVKVFHADGSTEINVAPSDTIENLKGVVNARTGKPASGRKIYFKEQVREDSCTLQSCGIENGSTIYFF